MHYHISERDLGSLIVICLKIKEKYMSHKILVSFSGGLDSATLLTKLIHDGHKPIAVNFNYGSKHNQVERAYAKSFCEKRAIDYVEVELPFVNTMFSSNLLQSGGEVPDRSYDKNSMSQTVVPGRNGIFMSILAGYAESVGASKIAIANHSGDHFIYPDCRPEWIAAINEAIRLGSEGKVQVVAPFEKMSKADIVKLGLELGIDYSETWSCYRGGEFHCGKCGTCVERRESFAALNQQDPTTYEAIQ